MEEVWRIIKRDITENKSPLRFSLESKQENVLCANLSNSLRRLYFIGNAKAKIIVSNDQKDIGYFWYADDSLCYQSIMYPEHAIGWLLGFELMTDDDQNMCKYPDQFCGNP